MADLPTRAAVLDTTRLLAGGHECASLEMVPPSSQFIFRGDSHAASAAGAAFGVSFPASACRACQSTERAALWLGPHEWLLIAPESQSAAVQEAIADAMAGIPHSLVGVGHRNVALRITGPGAALSLNAGCPLDLHPDAFPSGMCTRTILAKAPIILWRLEPEIFYVSAWRSFMPYIWDFLVEARARL